VIGFLFIIFKEA